MNTDLLLDIQNKLEGYVYNHGGDRYDDAAQTITICLERGYHELPELEFKRVAFRILKNLRVDRYRQAALQDRYFPVIVRPDQMDDHHRDMFFEDIISNLDLIEQQVLTLNMVEGWNMKSVAEKVGISHALARKIKMVAVQKLRDTYFNCDTPVG